MGPIFVGVLGSREVHLKYIRPPSVLLIAFFLIAGDQPLATQIADCAGEFSPWSFQDPASSC